MTDAFRPRRALAGCVLVLALLLAGCTAAPRSSAHLGRGSLAGYPRLALWWPDMGAIETSAAARYDLVVLQDYEVDKAVALRSANPSMIILDSTNACELEYFPGDLKRSAALAKVPAQWLLTQVGSTLAAPLDDRATTVPVAAVAGPGGLVLFARGDTIVVDDELMRVTAVDAGRRVLTVERGRVKPAAAHRAGSRVAATVSFYRDSLVLDLSENCPPARAYDSTTTETWARYAARTDAAMVADPIWSGVMTDRTDEGVSWLVGRAARSLDPDRSNRVSADYRRLDAQWAAGVRDYETRLRAALGERILLANWAMPNPALLNGNIFEGFPRDDGRSFSACWSETVFGPFVHHGGYLDLWGTARAPRVNVIATYRNDDSQTSSDSSPVGPQDYRKMRFGLATALLGEGLFAYEVNGRDKEGLFFNALYAAWFDEFDGAGLGRGYLGEPSGEPTRVAAPLTGADLVGAGGFENGSDLASWRVGVGRGCAAEVALDGTTKHEGSSSARFTVGRTDGVTYDAMLDRAGIPIAAATDYTVSFWGKADEPRRVAVWLQQPGGKRTVLNLGEVELGTEWREYQLSGTAEASDPSATLHLGFGQSTGVAWIDGLTLRRGSTAVWRRDFSKGVVLVNASSATQPVDLGGSYRKLSGSQDPTVNDGSLVTHVDLPAMDGLVLLRP